MWKIHVGIQLYSLDKVTHCPLGRISTWGHEDPVGVFLLPLGEAWIQRSRKYFLGKQRSLDDSMYSFSHQENTKYSASNC